MTRSSQIEPATTALSICSFLKANGVEKLANKRDWPKYVHQEPESYTPEQLEAFFAACDATEYAFFQFHLMTGFRKKEVAYTAWTDVDLKSGVVRVRASPNTASGRRTGRNARFLCRTNW